MTRTFARARVAAIVCALGVSGFGSALHAQVTIPQEYGKTIKSAEVVGALGNDLFGEQVNLYTGSTSFAVTDVSLPGNNALPVRIGRRYVVEDRDDARLRPWVFADWELDIPSLSGVFARNAGWQVYDRSRLDARCSVAAMGELMALPPEASGNQGGIFDAEEFWAGNSLHMPGQGDQEMLVVISGNPQKPTDGQQYYWTTSDRWYFSCLPSLSNPAKPGEANYFPGEGFLARAPDGTRYWFDWMVKRPVKILKKPGPGGPGLMASGTFLRKGGVVPTVTVNDSELLSRDEVRIYPTKVQDRFGNTVTYTYDADNPWRLLSITSSEVPARSLTMTYDAAGRIATVSDGTRTWTYIYDTSGDLSEVRLPDTSKWTYDLGTVGLAKVVADPTPYCETRSSSTTQSNYTGTITHPSGAIGTFVFRPTLHGRSYVQKHCAGIGVGAYARNPWLFDTIALQSKTISGPGISTPAQWTYTYGAPNNSWLENCPTETSCIGTKTVEVTSQGEWTRHTFSNRWRKDEGKLMKVEHGAGPTNILRTEVTDYQVVQTGQPYPFEWGHNPFNRGDNAAQKVTPVFRRTITQQGVTFTWKADVFDMYARPTQVTRSSTVGP